MKKLLLTSLSLLPMLLVIANRYSHRVVLNDIPAEMATCITQQHTIAVSLFDENQLENHHFYLSRARFQTLQLPEDTLPPLSNRTMVARPVHLFINTGLSPPALS